MASPLAELTQRRIDELASITDRPGQIHRTFLSPAMKHANTLVGGWMMDFGGVVEEDGWGNLIGHFPGAAGAEKTLLLGSHLDTVPNAGKYDGPLGVLVALAAVEALRERGVALPFHVDVLGFSDEEGTRFHSAYLGSGALAGQLMKADLDLLDADGITVRQTTGRSSPPSARYQAHQLLGYVEVHIEQGPLLELQGQPLGVVDAIAAQTRLVYMFHGRAGHAGTTPMKLRRDALAGASEFILAVERIGLATDGLVATVGALRASPGASNVIPDRVRLSVDIRHADRRVADAAIAKLALEAETLAARRGLTVEPRKIQSTDGVACDPKLVAQLAQAVGQPVVPHLVSGAGHDGIILSRLTPMGMLFVRCKDGLSHHPDEHVDLADIDAACAALTRFLENFR